MKKAPGHFYAFAEIKRPYLDSTKISDSEERNALEKVPVQFMALWKLSGKCHFLIQFSGVTEVRHIYYSCLQIKSEKSGLINVNGIIKCLYFITHVPNQVLKVWAYKCLIE